MSIFSHFQQRFASTQQEELTLQEYLELCKQDRSAYASAAERLLLAIGEPELVDTSNNSRLSRIFSNKVIRRYPAFEDFHGMEECIDQIVSYFRHAAQGLEEKKQILYLLGPVGGGKSSLAEKLKQLIEKVPFYAIKGSPVFESPLGLFTLRKMAQSSKKTSAYHGAISIPSCRPGPPTPGRVRRRYQPVPRGEALSIDPQSDRRGQD